MRKLVHHLIGGFPFEQLQQPANRHLWRDGDETDAHGLSRYVLS
jgi:hypothetical protein